MVPWQQRAFRTPLTSLAIHCIKKQGGTNALCVDGRHGDTKYSAKVVVDAISRAIAIERSMNSGARILSIYSKVVQYRPDNKKKMVYGWGSTFDIDVPNDGSEDLVIFALQALIAEIDLTRSRLLARDVTDELLSPVSLDYVNLPLLRSSAPIGPRMSEA
jgi:hypothetical protein